METLYFYYEFIYDFGKIDTVGSLLKTYLENPYNIPVFRNLFTIYQVKHECQPICKTDKLNNDKGFLEKVNEFDNERVKELFHFHYNKFQGNKDDFLKYCKYLLEKDNSRIRDTFKKIIIYEEIKSLNVVDRNSQDALNLLKVFINQAYENPKIADYRFQLYCIHLQQITDIVTIWLRNLKIPEERYKGLNEAKDLIIKLKYIAENTTNDFIKSSYRNHKDDILEKLSYIEDELLKIDQNHVLNKMREMREFLREAKATKEQQIEFFKKQYRGYEQDYLDIPVKGFWLKKLKNEISLIKGTFDIEHGLTDLPQPTEKQIKGFQSNLTDKQIQSLFDQLKGNYIDIKTNPDHFKAIFKDDPLSPEIRIQWTDKGQTRHEPNKQTLFEFLYLLKEYKYLNDANFDTTPDNKNNLYRKLETIFPNLLNFGNSNPFKPQKKTERQKELEKIILTLKS